MPGKSTIRKSASIAALICLAALCIACAFRAVAQPITVDEANVYFKYIRHRPFFAIFDTRYDPANHVLQTALAYATVHLLGPSEIGIRLPTLLAAPFYCVAAWRLAFLAFRRKSLAILALGLMLLNPLVLDYLSLARGYGIALTLFAWSLYFSLRYFRDREKRTLVAAGVLLGLNITANLTFAIPSAGLGFAMLSAICLPQGLRYVGSALSCAVVVLAVPLSSAHADDFYYGQPDAPHSIASLIDASLLYHGHMPLFFEWTESYLLLIKLLGEWIAPLAVLVIGLVTAAYFRTSHTLRLAGGSFSISILLLAIGHQVAGLKYPSDRTGLYLIFLFPLALIAAMDVLFERGVSMRWAIAPGIAVMAAILVVYCLEFHIGTFAKWAFAPDVNPYMDAIRARSPQGPVRIGGNFVFSYLVNFYREKHHSTWASFEPQSLNPGYDYYMFLPEDRHYVDQLGLRVLLDNRESILAARR